MTGRSDGCRQFGSGNSHSLLVEAVQFAGLRQQENGVPVLQRIVAVSANRQRRSEILAPDVEKGVGPEMLRNTHGAPPSAIVGDDREVLRPNPDGV